MKLSFVIPAYNEEDYIARCLESIEREAFGRGYDIEVIIVNNASTDGTRSVAEKFSFVKVVDEPTPGLSRARQAGFLASTGDLVANIDADTFLPPAWIDTAMKAFSNNAKLIALSGPQIFYDVPKTTAVLVKIFYYLDFLVYFANKKIFGISSMIQGGNFVVRRAALEKIGGYNPKFDFYGEDADISRRLHEIGDVTFTLKLPIYASGRRVMVEGKLRMASRYFINYIWTVFLGKPFTKTSVNVRAVPRK